VALEISAEGFNRLNGNKALVLELLAVLLHLFNARGEAAYFSNKIILRVILSPDRLE
jgi:hypothetical protein